MQSMIQSLGTQVGSFTTSVSDLGNKLNKIIAALDKQKKVVDDVTQAQSDLATALGDTTDVSESITKSFRVIKDISQNMDFVNNNIGGYGKAIQLAADRIDKVLQQADGFDLNSDKIIESFNTALAKSVGATASAQLSSVASLKQVQQALGALSQVITITKEQQSELDFKELTKSINSMDKETKRLVANLTGISLGTTGNFTKTGLVKASTNIDDEQKRQITKNLEQITSSFTQNVQPAPPRQSVIQQLITGITNGITPAVTAGAQQGVRAALTHPSVTSTVSTTLSATIQGIGQAIVKGIGITLVDTATNYGKYNVNADMGSSMLLKVAMTELQQATFDNAQAMLANAGGAKEFTSQLVNMTSNELIRKAGYDTAKALQITASTLTTVRSVIGREVTGAVAGKEAEDMVKFFQQSAATGHTTIEQYSDLAAQLSTNSEIVQSLNKLNQSSRTEALKSIIVTRDFAMKMGLGAEKAKEFAIALASTKNDSITSRYKAAGTTVSMVALAMSKGYRGMSYEELMRAQRLEGLGARRTAAENEEFGTLVPKVGGALAFLRQSLEGVGEAGAGTEVAIENFEKGLSVATSYASAVGKAAEIPGRSGLAAQTKTPGESGSITGETVTAVGHIVRTIQTTLDGIFAKGFTSALLSNVGVTLMSVGSMGLMTVALNANTLALGGKGLMSVIGGLISSVGVVGRVFGSLASIVAGGLATITGLLGGVVGYGVSSMLDRKDATKSETTGGGWGGTVGGTVGGIAGTLLGGPVGAAIGVGVGSVAGHYIGTAIGGWLGNSPSNATVSPTQGNESLGGAKADSYYIGAGSPAMQVTQPIKRQLDEAKNNLMFNQSITSPEQQATVENTEVLRGVLKAQQQQNKLMSDYIDIYKQSTEPPNPFTFTNRPSKEPHEAR